jgi:hypothetical protein
MLRIDAGNSRRDQRLNRRSFVQVGMAGMASLGLPDLLRLRAQAATPSAKDTSVILIWLDGGPSHIDLYDLKPEAPPERRGIWRPIATNVPGIEISEMFPLQARCADKFSIIRSLHHGDGDHFGAAHRMLTGHDGVNTANQVAKQPFVGSIATKATGPRKSGIPANVALPYAASVGLRPGYFGGNYLGSQYDPFNVEDDPGSAKFKVQRLQMPNGLTIQRLEDRRGLLHYFDAQRRLVDQSGASDAMNQFQRQAFDLVTVGKAAAAFDLTRESTAARDRYGRNTWGQSTLLARRLVEAGCTFVTVHWGGWDHHWELKPGMERFLPKLDQMVSALFDDLHDRGLLETTLVMICGEFSRNPVMNDGGGGGPPLSKGTPGRDHWGKAMCCVVGGGGVQGGRIIGSTDARGEEPKDHPLTPSDLHATMFHVLGVDPHAVNNDRKGRPNFAIPHGEAIHELF